MAVFRKPPKHQLDAEFDLLIASATEQARMIARETRLFIYAALPELTEIVWIKQKIAGYGTGPKKMSEHFCYIAINKDYITLGFNYGSELPDPAGLLEGTGNLYRHVKIKCLDELKKPALIDFLQFATGHRVPPIKSR
jgi:hypothetical protein